MAVIETETTNASPALAIVGAGGYVGARLAQLANLSGRFRVVPILRSHRGLARLGMAASQARVIEAEDLEALSAEIAGTRTVVNLIMGNPLRLLDDTRRIYSACAQAGVSQFIHLSSAVVFGQVTNPLTHDDSPPDVHSWMLYARQKGRAELWLRERLAQDSPRVVALRPGLIWGPGSSWSEMVGAQLFHGEAILSNGGQGIANLIYIDNLVRIILAVASQPSGPAGFYNVADAETVTWGRYYAGLAAGLGYPAEAVTLWPDRRRRLSWAQAFEWVMQQAPLHALAIGLKPRLGPRTKLFLQTKLRRLPGPPGRSAAPAGPPALSRSEWALQNTVHRLPATKVHRDFGPIELLSFREALEATCKALQFAGFAAPSARAWQVQETLSI